MSVGLHSQSVNADYASAVINYRVALQADLTKALVQANDPSSRLDKIKVDFSHPQSYASQYQQVIDMLEYSVDETINLDSQAFRAYVKDEWAWKGSFELTNSTYASKASAFSGAVGSARP
jgi:hypothetical protein